GAPRVDAVLDAAAAANADVIVMAGIAGALKQQFAVGQILAARHVSPRLGGTVVAADDDLLARARACGATVIDSFVSVDRTVAQADDKRALGAAYDAVDMESSIVLSAAHERGIRSIAIRVVGDTVSDDLPIDLTGAVRDDGTIVMARLIAQSLRRPSR